MYNQGNYQQFGQRLRPPPPFQQGPPPPHSPYGPPVSVPPSGMLISSQSFLIPSSLPPTAPQGSNWSQSQHHILPPIGHHLPPPPHPQGQHFYRVPLPLPPPLSSSYFTPAPFGSFVQPAHESSMGHLPPPPSPPPPPPSSPPPGPPPLPPSSPPPNSPLHPSSVSPSTPSKPGPSSSKPSDVEMVASGVIDRSNDTPRHVDGSEVGVKDISDPDIMADTHLPPPRPGDEKTVTKIEVLCQYIAKNGDEFEEMTCQKEVGNPEFEFLFGGAPGSEAAISHEYFKWMKKKCSSSELLDGRQNSGVTLRPSGVGSSLQHDGAMHAGVSCSPAGSDMDMEDDITQPEELGIGKSFGGANHEPAFISNEVDIKLEEQKCDSEHISPKDAKNENLFHSGSSGVVEQGANLDQDNAQFEKSFMKDSDADPEKHNLNLHQHANQSGPEVSSSEIPSEFIKGSSPFRLIQDYTSDDSSENDNDPHLENVSPEPVSPHVQTTTQDLDLTSLSPSVVKDSLNASEIPEPSTWKEDLDNNRTDSYPIMVKQDDRLASPKNGGSQKKGGNNKLEVDEFGRMVKAGARDSDSDDYTLRRGKRGRSRSRSRSPYERRRSPRRWREKRSRSRSWSPKKRTRSRSPYREAGGDWTRRDRNRIHVCLDFQRGKCFRGELCRYVHDSNNNDEYTRHKNKQHHQEAPHILKTSNKLSHENKETKFDQEDFIEPVTHGADNTTNQQQQPDLSGPLLQNPEDTLHQNDQISPFPPQLYNVTPTSKYPSSEIYPQLSVPPASTWHPLPLPPPPPLPPQYRHNLPPPPQINYPSQPFPMPYQPPPHIIQSFSGENLPAGRIQSFPGDNLPPSGRLPLPQYSLPGVPDFGIPRIMTHYNPYASTFDQPLSTKFSSSVFTQGVRSTNMNTSPSSTHYFTHNLATSGGAQYDPLFDSIDPSSNSFKRTDLNNNKIEETSNSNRLVTSLENDEFGETADAEVGAVENDSPSTPIDLADVATGEVEIDQVKNSSGKNKKIKDSRSMKLFKIALADFVKEVLKPSWRQGNMSKEAFKTIVKKTVDKVSGAMKKHQLPKSQAKINQYIDSSQRKLTKLVMGYVDKYVKV